MSSGDGFHPDWTSAGPEHAGPSSRTRVHHIKASELSADTAQTTGMQRSSSGRAVPSSFFMTARKKFASPQRPVTTSSSRRMFLTAKRIQTQKTPL
jgi:hypothetical protein